ncbi:MAG: DUF362 domain-containing protein [Methanobrevibacter sp.]|jgi:uncharacterized protein (DUF362 family)|nr:DUF362 domain-containing protein [Methanobrevibacter sp.]
MKKRDKIYINNGSNLIKMTLELLEMANIKEELNPEIKIIIKPNLVVSEKAENGATTHVEIVEAIVIYLKENNIEDITIAEGSWVGDGTSTIPAFKICGYLSLAEKYDLKILDTKKDSVESVKFDDLSLNVCKSFLDADFIINVPVLKGHCQTKITACLKNIKGCIPDDEKRRYHRIGLSKPIAGINTIIKPSLHIVDGICGDLNYECGGNPVEQNRIFLSKDPLLLDSYLSKLIGYNPEEIDYLNYGLKYGLGKFHEQNSEIIELNSDNRIKTNENRNNTEKNNKHKTLAIEKLEKFIDDDSSCSACYSSLIFALDKLEASKIENINEKIKIGQGFKKETIIKTKVGGIGIGSCCIKFEKNITGCPPTGLDILNFLKQILNNEKP